MRIRNEAILDLFRTPGPCSWCGRFCSRRDPHHFWFARGIGGGKRLDHPWNLIALCRACHDDAGPFRKITRYDLLAVVAKRENKQQCEILAELLRLYRGDKHSEEARYWNGSAVAFDYCARQKAAEHDRLPAEPDRESSQRGSPGLPADQAGRDELRRDFDAPGMEL